MSTALALTDITVTYPDGDRRLTALDRVSLRVDAGEMVAVVGPSGSGKSTLLAVAGLLLTPDSGRVEIDGRDVSGLRRGDAADVRRTTLGLVFQQSNLIESLTAREQLQIVARVAGSRGPEVDARADELLAAVGLTDAAGRRPHQLSGGQRQRVGIARALMNDPALLLVDEPTSALDHERGAAVVALLAEVTRERGVGTVMVTHDRSSLAAVDHTVEMGDGRLAALAS
ncbi:ABC transporter ATP-binding protein [Luteipulveratus halotolerans]|uniref:ABC transporter ATP-binding protein n=1 Tax=Luteipulveratus halotolerans TaxID=1631356 RepID=A0A0L6CL42_9MICO|nr:ABC transporter ATP-binding protein [Luteipulveratus halotolerans]KNX38472.1 ABC transporter ATP-binding protein [Luteipulveratus halotolerans]